jgi:putative ABC transport system ATP-binding protein
MPPVIELRNVGKAFREGSGARSRERRVLHGVNATLHAGQAAVLLGRSGSGKSTLLNLLGGLDLPSEGEIRVEGESLGSMTERERTHFRRRRIGFVFQSFNLIPTLTVEENLLLPQELKEGVTAEGRRRALELLDQVGLADRARSFPDVLSGGEQQRVAVARALSHDPSLVLADEPTGNLDAETGVQVMALLEALTRRSGKTLVLVTHSPELAGFADRFFRMVGGTLEEIPRPAQTAS